MDYHQAWTFLDNLQFFKIKLGLEAMERFLEQVDTPQKQLSCVHIGGTNGKGSVGATLLSILTTAGYRVGLYTSPHLSSVRERFRIGNTCISEKDFAELTTEIVTILGRDQITYFEFTTTLALLWFSRQQVDLALMEVGMGGRLDATNVITPLVSIITNVSMDHEQYLGTTLEAVAGEKAGIIKPGIPVVSGVADDISREILVNRCAQQHSPLYIFGPDFFGAKISTAHWEYTGLNKKKYTRLPLAMRGDYQISNAALALTAIELLQPHGFKAQLEHLHKGLAETHWPGRLEEFQLEGKHFLLDGAHNPAGVQALARALQNEMTYDRLVLVWGAMADKDISTTLKTIAPFADHILFTRPESDRSAAPKTLLDNLPTSLQQRADTTEDVETALQKARQRATKDDLICVAGSLYLVGRARQILLGELV